MQDDESDPALLTPNEPKLQSESSDLRYNGPDKPTVALHSHETDAVLEEFMCSREQVSEMPERFIQVLSSSVENVKESEQGRQNRCKKDLGMQTVGDLGVGKLGAACIMKLNCVSNNGERFEQSSGYSSLGVVVPRHLTRLVGHGTGPCDDAQEWLISELRDPNSALRKLAANEGLTTYNTVGGQRS